MHHCGADLFDGNERAGLVTKGLFDGRSILVVEDEFFIADAMQRWLEDAGAHVVGPAASVDDALALLDSEPVNGAILDVNLNDEHVFPVANVLTARGIPFVFATGYSASDIPPAWRHVALQEKPVNKLSVARALFVDQPRPAT